MDFHGWARVGLRPYDQFIAHSVVSDPLGQLIDITPLAGSASDYPFIRHPGTDQDFGRLMALELLNIRSYTDGLAPAVIYESLS